MGHIKTLSFRIINRANKNSRAVYWRRQGKMGRKHVPFSNLSTTAHFSFPLPSIQFHSLTSASHSIPYPEPREIHCPERELHFDSRSPHGLFLRSTRITSKMVRNTQREGVIIKPKSIKITASEFH